MAVVVYLGLLLLLGLTGQSSATYCLCNSGLNDTVLQKDIDYACGAGADCTAILSTGACYNPNTVKAHCDYAVNSYYQRKGQAVGSCDFSGTAAPSTTGPTSVGSGCVYQSSPSSTTPSTTPSTSTGTGTGTGTGTSTGTGTGTTTPSTTTSPSVYNGLGPSGTGIIDNPSGASPLGSSSSSNLVLFLVSSTTTTLWFLGLIWWG